MATMIGAGIPIAQTVRAIGKGHESAAMSKLMMEISREVESGSSLSIALSKHPQYFNRLFVSLTEAGEESGKLDTMLDRVATYNEKLEALKSKVKGALMYPIVVLVIALVVSVLLLLFVIPTFENLFQGVGGGSTYTNSNHRRYVTLAAGQLVHIFRHNISRRNDLQLLL